MIVPISKKRSKDDQVGYAKPGVAVVIDGRQSGQIEIPALVLIISNCFHDSSKAEIGPNSEEAGDSRSEVLLLLERTSLSRYRVSPRRSSIAALHTPYVAISASGELSRGASYFARCLTAFLPAATVFSLRVRE
jgi:hypothetical protein